jgi:hypothetical protein
VPEPENPQALNRYSYVYDNPLKYRDPSGHWIFEEEPEDPLVYYGSDLGTLARSWRPSSPNHVVEPAERQEVLERYAARLYAQRGEGRVTDLEFAAQLADYRASFGESKSFVDDISRIILGGRGGWHTLFYAPTHRHHLDLRDSDFTVFYRDGSNQVNHAWYGVHIGHFFGHELAERVQAAAHEAPNLPIVGGGRLAIPGPGGEIVIAPGGGASYADYVLTRSGGTLGAGIRNKSVNIEEVGTWIRANWGPWPLQHLPAGW